MNPNVRTISQNALRRLWHALDTATWARDRAATDRAVANIRRDLVGIDPATPLVWSRGYTVADLADDGEYCSGSMEGCIDRLDYLPPPDLEGVPISAVISPEELAAWEAEDRRVLSKISGIMAKDRLALSDLDRIIDEVCRA